MSAPAPFSQAMIDVLDERRRQTAIEGYDAAHDDTHTQGEIARAAAVYAAGPGLFRVNALQVPQQVWPYRWEYKPKGERSNLVRAAAMLIAEVERLDRLDAKVAIPADRSQQQLTDGRPVTDDHRELLPNGQQKGYVVLTEAERAKGFVRPYRDAYRHSTCGAITTMGRAIAETYARDPQFYSGTFCSKCRAHFPVGPDGQFTWYEMDGREGPKVGT